MKNEFDKIRRTIEDNLKLYRLFLIVSFFVFVALSLVGIFATKALIKPILTGFGASGSSMLFFFFGYLNYRAKIPAHDVMVKQYDLPPPPSKSSLIKDIISNSKFKPLKLKD